MASAPRVVATEAALAVIARLREAYGPLVFHQSCGCCDGSVPMCFPRGEHLVGAGDGLLGEVGGTPFFVSAAELHRRGSSQLVLDVAPGRGAPFSLEGALGVRFLARSRDPGEDAVAEGRP
jgi:uncharacterized protein (DUF779 family)